MSLNASLLTSIAVSNLSNPAKVVTFGVSSLFRILYNVVISLVEPDILTVVAGVFFFSTKVIFIVFPSFIILALVKLPSKSLASLYLAIYLTNSFPCFSSLSISKLYKSDAFRSVVSISSYLTVNVLFSSKS